MEIIQALKNDLKRLNSEDDFDLIISTANEAYSTFQDYMSDFSKEELQMIRPLVSGSLMRSAGMSDGAIDELMNIIFKIGFTRDRFDLFLKQCSSFLANLNYIIAREDVEDYKFPIVMLLANNLMETSDDNDKKVN